MGAFSIYIQYKNDATIDETAEELLDRLVAEHDGVTYESGVTDAETESGVTVPDRGLDIETIEAYASVFETLKGNPAVHDISLWGPGSQRYPLRVYHYALRELSAPDQYQFHAIDNRETLLICESPQQLRRAREEIGTAGLVTGGEAAF